MKFAGLWILAFAALSGAAEAATTLPVGPLSFTNLSDYDNNFKERETGAEFLGVAAGTLRVFNPDAAASGATVYDTSVTPGTGGVGGTGGADANNDLSNFTISSTINFQNRGVSATVGYFLRLNESEAGGYLAAVSFFNSSGTISLRFDLYKNVGITFLPTASATGSGQLFTQTIAFPTSAAADFTYAVTAVDSQFSFSLRNAAGTSTATASYTDVGLAITTGQVGLYLGAQSNSTTRVDNVSVTQPVPEPSSLMLLGVAGILGLSRRKTRVA